MKEMNYTNNVNNISVNINYNNSIVAVVESGNYGNFFCNRNDNKKVLAIIIINRGAIVLFCYVR